MRNRGHYKTIHRRVERFTEALDAPSLDLVGPVELDEFYVSAGLKGRESATSGRALAVPLNADAERMNKTNRPFSF